MYVYIYISICVYITLYNYVYIYMYVYIVAVYQRDPDQASSLPPGSVSFGSSSWVAGIFSSSELIMATSSPGKMGTLDEELRRKKGVDKKECTFKG